LEAPVNGFIGALLALLEPEEPVILVVSTVTLPQLGTQLGEKPRFSPVEAGICGLGTEGLDSEPQAAKVEPSNPLLSCIMTVEGELKFVGEGPNTFVIGDGLTGCVAKGDEPKMEAPADCPSLTVTVDLKISSSSFNALYLSVAFLDSAGRPGGCVTSVAGEAVMIGGPVVTLAGATSVFLDVDQGSGAESN